MDWTQILTTVLSGLASLLALYLTHRLKVKEDETLARIKEDQEKREKRQAAVDARDTLHMETMQRIQQGVRVTGDLAAAHAKAAIRSGEVNGDVKSKLKKYDEFDADQSAWYERLVANQVK